MTINERVSAERLDTIKSWRETYGQDSNVMIPASEAEAIISELQQYRAAAEKPIGSFHIIDQQVDGTTDYVKDGEWPIDNGELLVYAAPQVTSVPDESAIFDAAIDICRKSDAIDEHAWNRGVLAVMSAFRACRAAMIKAAPAVQAAHLSGNTEHLSQPYTLVGEVVQWNHPTKERAVDFRWFDIDVPPGTKLYAVNHPVIPDSSKRVPNDVAFEKWWEDEKYDEKLRNVQGVMFNRVKNAAFQAFAAGRDGFLATQDNWIPVSERMPGSRHAVLVGCWFGSEWTSKWATYVPGHPDAQDGGWLIPGASWTPTHWHELPAAPKQDFREIPNSSTNNCRENADSSTKCWCRTCRPITVTDMRFVVCPECGNKRCPHANDHRNACTGSNEPGQEGSAYPDAQKQEAE